MSLKPLPCVNPPFIRKKKSECCSVVCIYIFFCLCITALTFSSNILWKCLLIINFVWHLLLHYLFFFSAIYNVNLCKRCFTKQGISQLFTHSLSNIAKSGCYQLSNWCIDLGCERCAEEVLRSQEEIQNKFVMFGQIFVGDLVEFWCEIFTF